MLTPTSLDTTVVEEIARIGELRRPNEACGILLPFAWRGKRVWEIPNRADMPRDSFVMTSEDIVLTLQGWIDAFPEEAMWGNIAVWHTHPAGSVGPSRTDINNRIAYCGNLVVSLHENGALATWF